MGLAPASQGQASADLANIMSIGGSYGGGLGAPGISYNLLPNYAGTISPGAVLNYEAKIGLTFGIGTQVTFASANVTGNNIPYNIADPTGNQYAAGTVTDKVSGLYFGVAARPTYHFNLGSRIDPYMGLTLGFTITSESSTISSPTIGSFNTQDTYAGVLLGGFIGMRIYITKNVGIWLEAGYAGIPSYLGNAGVFYQLTHF